MNKTDMRILKLSESGLSDEQIAKKIGRPDDMERVRRALRDYGKRKSLSETQLFEVWHE